MSTPFHLRCISYFRSILYKPQNAATICDSSLKCTDCRVQIQAMQRRMHALQEQIKDHKYEISTLHKRNQYLKTFEPKHVKKSEECSVCKLKFTTDELYLHLCQQLNNESNIQCEYCLKLYSSTTKLLNHLRVSHDYYKLEKKIYRCEQCPQIFGMAKLMDIHMRTHPKEMPKIKSTENHCAENIVQMKRLEMGNPFLKRTY